ncbi:MAG: LysR family transcriptional regulator [Ornithinimicrobium sp.]
MFEISRLVFLHAVHRHGSVTAAARELGYTSSAISQQIGKPEREVEVRLPSPVSQPRGHTTIPTLPRITERSGEY